MKYFMIKLVAGAYIFLVLCGIAEKLFHRKNLAAIPIRILVNGTRGKTSVTRLLTAAMNEAGIRTLGKTTGTEAALILPDGTEASYRKKWRLINIREQIPFARRAKKLGVEAVAVECMALHPENQLMMGKELVRPTLTLITNTRVDHLAEIGRTPEETAAVLALSVPKGGEVITRDPVFKACMGLPTETAPEETFALPDGYLNSFPYPVFEDNIQLVLQAAARLGIDRETALRGMQKAKPDIGMRGPYAVGESLFINAFAANDPVSARTLYAQYSAGYEEKPLIILFNHRRDRAYRIDTFAALIRELKITHKGGTRVYVCGDDARTAARRIAGKTGAGAEAMPGKQDDFIKSLKDSPCLVLALGNIHHGGREMLERLEKMETAEKPEKTETEEKGPCWDKP